ncbi:L-histidine Nalpha-methyltransferase [Saccharopolyspora kobensis]|uniref:Histidine N-alpha-methyltransferase n=1 Tax=Saccharopolyspora kobensis TaxID=146035 RepID=A0A1H5XS14_9PSEU|nr:L-histidine N(alpha)-methyltransferase [Saccharopolyspora kobensis]SEG14200.1 L-histidine Nalpha-methyltransferase [Saccharopolyspora kobensis]SFE39060.1 L-histidine Nalpha-methyltransferase [Saccharopolyspora kobensis]
MSEPELIVRFTDEDAARELRADVREGLTEQPKWLSPKWFYDAAGSELFERITTLPEYYQTRAEQQILQRTAMDIAEITGAATLVELGSGSSEKTRLLLDALRKHGTLHRFVPLDVSGSALRAAVDAIALDYPELLVRGVVDDFTSGLSALDAGTDRLVAFLGGTIGNLLPAERAGFFASVRSALRPGEWLLLGTDLVKDPERLVRAYDDASGVTAEFNRNVLRVLNRELGADFAVEEFGHVALWNAEQEWIEMRLRAARPMRVELAELALTAELAAGEEIRTEISAKFRRERVRDELTTAGFDLRHWWLDDAGDFALSLAVAR